MSVEADDNKKPYVILRSVSTGERFFTTNSGGDPTRLTDGSIGYTVLGYRDTVEECQVYLFGRSFTT